MYQHLEAGRTGEAGTLVGFGTTGAQQRNASVFWRHIGSSTGDTGALRH
jgi:hypothetical protein